MRTAAERLSVARTAVLCVGRLLARVQLGEPRLVGLCLGRRAPASGHRPVRSPRAWRRQAGAARAGGAVVSIRGGCGGARAVLTKRPCAAACVRKLRLRSSSAFSRSSRVHGPLGRRAASAWSRVRALSALVRRGGRRGHARRHRVLPVPVRRGCRHGAPSFDQGRSRGTNADDVFATATGNQYLRVLRKDIPRAPPAVRPRLVPSGRCEACSLPRTGGVSLSRAASVCRSAFRDDRLG